MNIRRIAIGYSVIIGIAMLDMLLYTVIISASYFAERGDVAPGWYVHGFFYYFNRDFHCF
jgi:hypothetical protein